MNFTNLLHIHHNIEKKFPQYEKALCEHMLTEEEKTNKEINTEVVDIDYVSGYMINKKFIDTSDDIKFINWDDFLVPSVLCSDSAPTCKAYHEVADRIMYCLYLYAIDNSDTRAELCNIFSNEKLPSQYFCLDCNYNYSGKHYVDKNGWCICQFG